MLVHHVLCILLYSIALTKQNFTLKYDTNIPRQVVRMTSDTCRSACTLIWIWPSCMWLTLMMNSRVSVSMKGLAGSRWIVLFGFAYPNGKIIACILNAIFYLFVIASFHSAIVSATLKCLMKFYNITDDVRTCGICAQSAYLKYMEFNGEWEHVQRKMSFTLVQIQVFFFKLQNRPLN